MRFSAIAVVALLLVAALPVEAQATADFTMSASDILRGEAVTFTDTSTGTYDFWIWDFGDGSLAALQSPVTHIYTTAGTFTVQLTISQGSTALDTITKTVVVTAPTLTPRPRATSISVAPGGVECVAGVPCGYVPWRMPRLPILHTPTPLPSRQPTALPTYVVGESATPTSTPDYFSADSFSERVATLGAIMNATPLYAAGPDGNYAPTDLDAIVAQGGTFFGYVKAFASADIGIMTPLLLFIITRFTVKMSFAFIRILVPVAAALLGIIRKIIQLILDFIPL